MFADARSLKAIFQTALEKDTAADRAAYLEEACAGNRDLRRRVDSLLRLHDQPDRLLDQPAAQHLSGAEESLDFLEPTTRPDALGQLGHLTVLDVVGRGGMGIVLRAFDEKLHRVVAIKALAPLLASSGSARQRFVREARAAAAVTHEHVIGIYAVEDGGPVPYLVMQFVAGKTLQEKLDQSGPLPLPETLRIGLQIAEGLAAAHRQGIVHRDIKPANILLENGVERVKITDFGLARTMDDASVTRSGIVAGTPAYMSPEQAGGERIDQRSDLFSLGSVLYALCAGHPPFRAESAMAVLRRVCDDTPRPLREVNPAVPEWLAALVAKLQAKKPADRFATAAEVGTLLSRHLAQLQSGNESSDDVGPTEEMEIPARPGRRGVRYGAALVLVLVALAAWFVATHWPDGRKGSPDAPVLPAEPLALKPAKTLTGHNGGVLVVAFSPNGKLLASAGEDRTILLWDTDAWKSRRLPTEHPGDLSGLAFAPDGTTLASVASTGDACCVRLWNLATGKQEATIGGTHAGLSGVVWSPDGTLAAGGWDGTLRVWDAATRAERFSVANVCTPFVRGLAFSPKGSERIVTGGSGPTRLWNAQTGAEIVTEPMPEMCPTFLPNGDIVGWVHRAGRVVICEASSGKVRVAWPAHRGLIEGLAVAPDGRFVASFDPEGTARLWSIAGSEPTELATLTGHRGSIYAAAFAPDGKYLATAGKGDFTVRLWELPPLCHVRKP